MSILTRKKSKKLQNRSLSMDLSTSTDKQNKREEILHFSHPDHPLVQTDFPYLFMCMGCKEYGAGKRFMCQMCGFELHDFCALAPPSLHNHPFHEKHQLVFFTKPGGFLRSKCDICGKSAKGYTFRCTICSFEMHPCCATMQREMDFPTHHHPLLLAPALGGTGGQSGFICQICRRKRPGQVYQCKACDYHLHALCAKDLVNGLYVHGITLPEKTNGIATAVKLTMQALFGIVSGLIGGIGEGIGEALIENIGKTQKI